MPSYSVRRSKIKEFKEIAGSDLTDSVAEKVLGNNSWNVQTSLNDFFNNRHKYPQAKQGDTGKLKKLFKKYGDKEDPSIMSEKGMLQFFKDVKADVQGIDTLVIAWRIQSTEMGLIQKDEFVNGFEKLGCTDIKSIKNAVSTAIKSTNNITTFRIFYKWLFHHVKEDEKKKTIDKALGIQLWRITLKKKKSEMPLMEKYINYIEKESDLQAISRDLWEQSLDFLKETKKPSDYDENGAWPIAIDEFMETQNS